MQYRREIDGLRAVAILFIMLFHSNLNYLNGGYIGVDIFFVISGYLISSKIINDIKSNQFSIFDFWERRARRILPALFFVLAFSTLIAFFVFFPSDLMNFSASLISVITLTSNIYFSKTTGYFQTTSDLIPLIHTWSLAVEEHFYLFFPILLVLWVKRNKRLLSFYIIGIFIISYSSCLFFSSNYTEATFFLTPTRIWEFILGVIASQIDGDLDNLKLKYIYNNILSILGLFCIFYAAFFLIKIPVFH
jgi:peptidoglycan/LPS O-acetylase OafA/YrhL